MTVDLDALEALAKAATPGPWGLYLGAAWQVITDAPDWEQREVATTGPEGSTGSEDDAAFIAAAGPSTVLALVAELRQERERADDLYAANVGLVDAAYATDAALSRAEETIAAQGTEEPEWEYTWEGPDWCLEVGRVWDTVQECENAPESRWARQEQGQIARRRKAGPWVPVEQEEEGTA